MQNQKSKKIIKNFLKEKAVDILMDPLALRNLPEKAQEFISSAVDIVDISKLPERLKNMREKGDKEILRIMYLLLSVEKNISAEQLNILNQIVKQFGSSCKVEYSEFTETVNKLQNIRNNSTFEEYCDAFIDEVKSGCNDIQNGFLGLTILTAVRRAYVIWIVASLSINTENYSAIRQLLEKLSNCFKPTRTDQAAKTALFGKKDDNYLMKLLKGNGPITRLIDAAATAIEYDSENIESYIQTDFIQAVENDCKLILKLSYLAETERNPDMEKKIVESVEQITAYLLDRISPHDVSREFELDD